MYAYLADSNIFPSKFLLIPHPRFSDKGLHPGGNSSLKSGGGRCRNGLLIRETCSNINSAPFLDKGSGRAAQLGLAKKNPEIDSRTPPWNVSNAAPLSSSHKFLYSLCRRALTTKHSDKFQTWYLVLTVEIKLALFYYSARVDLLLHHNKYRAHPLLPSQITSHRSEKLWKLG